MQSQGSWPLPAEVRALATVRGCFRCLGSLGHLSPPRTATGSSHALFCTTSKFTPSAGAVVAEVWCKVRVGITEYLQKTPGNPAAVATIVHIQKDQASICVLW